LQRCLASLSSFSFILACAHSVYGNIISNNWIYDMVVSMLTRSWQKKVIPAVRSPDVAYNVRFEVPDARSSVQDLRSFCHPHSDPRIMLVRIRLHWRKTHAWASLLRSFPISIRLPCQLLRFESPAAFCVSTRRFWGVIWANSETLSWGRNTL
jgi:hypothetical protein